MSEAFKELRSYLYKTIEEEDLSMFEVLENLVMNAYMNDKITDREYKWLKDNLFL